MYSILIIDDETAIRTMLTDFLEEYYEVCSTSSAEKAIEYCEKRRFDLVISDINMPGIKGHQLLNIVHNRWPGTRTALITAYNIDEYILLARDYGITNIIPKTSPFNFTELKVIVEGLTTKEIFGLPRYLLPDARMLAEYTIHSSNEGRDVREQVIALFADQFGTSGEMKLVLDEIITNAIYHSSQHSDGTRKYPEFSDLILEPHEYVHVVCGYDSEKYGVAIVDNQGRLTKETVLTKMSRQIGGEGILDDSGRGIHMSRLFSDRMIINLHANVKTEVILMNYFSAKYRGYKPLYMNEL